MESKLLTDAEVEEFNRFLTRKEKKNLLIEALLNTDYGKNLLRRWLEYKRIP